MGVILWSRSEEVTTQLNNQTKNKHIMKAFAPVLMALVAGAKAEADPQYLTAYGGLYGGVRSVIPSTYGYAYNPYNRVVALGKREAEAEPEADAQLLYGNRFGYSGLGYNTWGLNAYNTYNPYNRVVALGKREAEASLPTPTAMSPLSLPTLTPPLPLPWPPLSPPSALTPTTPPSSPPPTP